MNKLTQLLREQKEEFEKRFWECESIVFANERKKNAVKDYYTTAQQQLIDVIIVMMKQYQSEGVAFNHYMEHHMQHGYQKALQTQINLLEEAKDNIV
jgi:hypothetical protein